ncbi:hypothetical protein [Nisaea sp.]|uniref:hypothetical protein n=1 Tax=Nisaea sp. TaxID=2024842 RepID=UPI0032636946
MTERARGKRRVTYGGFNLRRDGRAVAVALEHKPGILFPTTPTTVTPAQAGVQRSWSGARHPWIPSFDGMMAGFGRNTRAAGN